MNPNMIGTSVEVVVNMTHHSPYNGISGDGKMAEKKNHETNNVLNKKNTHC